MQPVRQRAGFVNVKAQGLMPWLSEAEDASVPTRCSSEGSNPRPAEVFRQDLLPAKCYSLSMTEQKTRPAGATYHGFVPDTDPRYNSGWNYLSGKNLNLPSKEKLTDEAPEAASEPSTGQTARRAAKETELFARLGKVKQYPIAPDDEPDR
jgi:hypothetical protein